MAKRKKPARPADWAPQERMSRATTNTATPSKTPRGTRHHEARNAPVSPDSRGFAARANRLHPPKTPAVVFRRLLGSKRTRHSLVRSPPVGDARRRCGPHAAARHRVRVLPQAVTKVERLLATSAGFFDVVEVIELRRILPVSLLPQGAALGVSRDVRGRFRCRHGGARREARTAKLRPLPGLDAIFRAGEVLRERLRRAVPQRLAAAE